MGTLLIDRNAPSFEGGVAHVWVEQAAPADAPAKRLAETTIRGVLHRSGEADEVPFGFDNMGAVPANARLRAWIDVASNGAPGPDDLYSTQATKVVDFPCLLRVEQVRP